MPETRLVFFREDDGTVPLLDWLDGLSPRAKAKCLVKLTRLKKLGYELRRPEADYLRDGIYELRIGLAGINYRMLYFFHGTIAAVLSHGLVKERAVPAKEIDAAVERSRRFERDPKRHTCEG